VTPTGRSTTGGRHLFAESERVPHGILTSTVHAADMAFSYPLPDSPPTAQLPGSSEPPPPRRPFHRRHEALVGAAALVVAAGIGAGLTLLLTGGGSSTTAAAVSGPAATVPATTPAPLTAGAAGTKPKVRRVRGVVQSESGTTWTIQTPAGRTVTVTVGAGTAFGTVAAPSTAAQFPVGSTVVVVGTIDHGTATARRIVAPKPAAATAPTTTAPAAVAPAG